MKINKIDSIKIRALRDAGIGYGNIAKQLGLKKGTVAKHCQKQDHLAHLPPKEKTYRGAIKGRKCLEIKQYIMWNPNDSLKDIINGCDLNISTKTLSQYLKRFGMPTKIAKRKIVISDINKRKRVEFAKEWVGKTDAQLASIWFSDETIVKSRPNGEVVLYRCPPGAEWFEPSNGSGGKSVMFWGVISRNAYGPLVEVRGKNTAERYVETLNEYLLPELDAAEGPVTFQQDNAKIHKTPAVMSFLEENKVNTFEWPPQSPDLSPIENIWNIMKMRLKAMKPRPRSHAAMRDTMLKLWLELEDKHRIDLIDSFRQRLKMVIKSKGELIKI